MDVSEGLVRELTEGARQYLAEYDDSELLHSAAQLWAEADALTGPTRPTVEGIKIYLQDVVRGVLKDIAEKHADVASMTLTFATEQLLIYLTQELGWAIQPEYTIPLKLLSALVYRRALKELGGRI